MRSEVVATLRRYSYGLERISLTTPSQGAYYYSHDALGSVTNLTNPAGAKARSYRYEPFGAVRSSVQEDPAAPLNPMRFAGELHDDLLGQIHLRARQYNPADGRFQATDPLAPSMTSPYTSTYAYANNQPTALIDPSGLGAVWAQHDSCGFLCFAKDFLIGDPLHNPVDALTLIPILKIGKVFKVAAKGGRGADDIFKGLPKGRQPHVRTVRSDDELRSIYDELAAGGKSVDVPGYPGKWVERPDGTRIGIREGSKSGGASIDIRRPDGSIGKVHVG